MRQKIVVSEKVSDSPLIQKQMGIYINSEHLEYIRMATDLQDIYITTNVN